MKKSEKKCQNILYMKCYGFTKKGYYVNKCTKKRAKKQVLATKTFILLAIISIDILFIKYNLEQILFFYSWIDIN